MRAAFESFELEIYGESHAPSIGMRLGGLKEGSFVSLAPAVELLDRRRSGGIGTTARREADEIQIVGGLVPDGDGFRVSGDVCLELQNNDIRPNDYASDGIIPRPSHADFAAYMRDGELHSGGGRFSGRMTAAVCLAGGVAKSILSPLGLRVEAYIRRIGPMELGSALDGKKYDDGKRLQLPMLDKTKYDEAEKYLCAVAAEGDSVGGELECVIDGLRAGQLGECLFEGLEGKLAYAIFGIPAVKGVEFGAGFGLGAMRGSQANDQFRIEDGQVRTATNNSGGINGGISNGMPIVIGAAVRPTPSIALGQRSVRLDDMTECELKIRGRHDACILPRAVACMESAVWLALLDEMMKYGYV